MNMRRNNSLSSRVCPAGIKNLQGIDMSLLMVYSYNPPQKQWLLIQRMRTKAQMLRGKGKQQHES